MAGTVRYPMRASGPDYQLRPGTSNSRLAVRLTAQMSTDPRTETQTDFGTSPLTPKGGIRDGLARLPGGVWALGFTSLFMDTSSELVHSLLPVFLATVLGASMATIGILEGAAEATAAITKVFSGTLSDYLGRRKFLVVFGYGLGAATKPIFPLATSVAWVFGARFVDRIGKGIRGAPRDALVADLTPLEVRGAAYGLRQSLDTVGAFLGPLLAMVLMTLLASDIRTVLWGATVPGVLSVLLLIVAVREPERSVPNALRAPISPAEVRRLPRRYWLIVVLGAVLTLARFSEAFLVLRAGSVGVRAAAVPLVLVMMNVVYALSAYPAGVAADRVSRRGLLALGLGVLLAADLVLAAAPTPLVVFAGVALWGLHLGLTQGLLATLVAATAPDSLRGTAFGLFNLLTGVVLLPASIVAGVLWTRLGPSATFLAGAIFSAIALLGLLLLYRERDRPCPQ
jgi:MFS family permease